MVLLVLAAFLGIGLAPARADCTPTSHVIQPGETLSALAAQFDTTVDLLATANGLANVNDIEAGQTLRIVCPGAVTTLSNCSAQTHIVQPGETLYSIALQYHVSAEQLMALNDLKDPNLIQAGAKLFVVPCLPVEALTRAALLLSRVGAITPPLPGGAAIAPGRQPGPYDVALQAAQSIGVHQMSLYPPVVAQGGTAWLHIATTKPLSVTVRIAGRPLQILVRGDDLFCLVPMHALAKVGLHWIDVQMADGQGKQLALRWPLPVRAGGYIHQTITIPPGRQALLDPAVVKEEIAQLATIWAQSSGPPLWQGVWRKPFDGNWPPTSPFGARRVYVGGAGLTGFHSGQDFALPAGTPVLAPADGIVLYAGPLHVRGNVVILSHGAGVASGYWHLSRVDVVKGEMVRGGQQIALSGNTGLSTGAHLHWETRVDGIAVTPWQWLQPAWAAASIAPLQARSEP